MPRLARRLLPVLLVGMLADGATAQSLDSVVQVVQATHAEAAASQERVDALADETRSLLSDYRAELQQVDSLTIYNEQLEKLIESQRAEMQRIHTEIEEVTAVEREIMPFMSRMIDTLARFVEADVPFLLDERRARVQKLRDLLLRSDVTVAEKYRRLMEAWQIENHFGHSIEAYTGELELDGEPRQVDFLRIGRVALFYRTFDGERAGAWDGSGFQAIDVRFYAHLKRGLAIARKQAPPGLLLLPVAAGGE